MVRTEVTKCILNKFNRAKTTISKRRNKKKINVKKINGNIKHCTESVICRKERDKRLMEGPAI